MAGEDSRWKKRESGTRKILELFNLCLALESREVAKKGKEKKKLGRKGKGIFWDRLEILTTFQGLATK